MVKLPSSSIMDSLTISIKTIVGGPLLDTKAFVINVGEKHVDLVEIISPKW
jgi:hypothetical protein